MAFSISTEEQDPCWEMLTSGSEGADVKGRRKRSCLRTVCGINICHFPPDAMQGTSGHLSKPTSSTWVLNPCAVLIQHTVTLLAPLPASATPSPGSIRWTQEHFPCVSGNRGRSPLTSQNVLLSHVTHFSAILSLSGLFKEISTCANLVEPTTYSGGLPASSGTV